MIRRNFLKGMSLVSASTLMGATQASNGTVGNGTSDRDYWVSMLTRITGPVLEALAQDKLVSLMPVESAGSDRGSVTYLEAIGRSLAGLAPWLESGADSKREGTLRKRFLELACRSIHHAVTPSSVSYMNFTKGGQPLVDAAFLAHALLRAPSALWGNIDKATRDNLIIALRSTRAIKPPYSNWLLFTAMVEAALLKFAGDYDAVRIDYALKQHEAWYKGDGVYGDGPDFHFDYYNSFVIQPMLLDVTRILHDNGLATPQILQRFMQRARRYAEIQERLISPEGTFPPIGRSLAYRCGAFQLLAQLALEKGLPDSLPPPQVRSALTAVIRRSMESPGTFDKNGWLTIGFGGHQPEIGEHYISTGSLYLCTAAFLPLGLSSDDEFWSQPPMEWTSKKAYAGKNFPIDKAL